MCYNNLNETNHYTTIKELIVLNYMTKKSIMDRLQEHYNIAKEKENGEIFAIFLQGSQNYINDFFSEDSDVDSRAIYLPKMKDICLNIDISQPELILENGEHIDRFDIRKFLKLIQTPGINNYESLFTEYAIVNPKYKSFYDRLVDIRENIVRVNEKKFLMATSGLSKRDMLSLQKRTGGEDYDIKNFGYSRKRLSNIIRFNKTIKAYLDNKPFSDCLKSMDQELIHKIRRTEHYTLEEALEIAEQTDSNSNVLAQSRKEAYDSIEIMNTKSLLEEIFVDLMIAGSDYINNGKD